MSSRCFTFVPSFPSVQFVREQLASQDVQSCQLLKSFFFKLNMLYYRETRIYYEDIQHGNIFMKTVLYF